MPAFAVVSQTAVACICYMIIMGDLARDVAAAWKVLPLLSAPRAPLLS
jgi:hypothetical protein